MEQGEPRGRLVVLTGKGIFGESQTLNDLLKRLNSDGVGVVRADIGISGKGYSKYGTTYDNRLIIIDKGVKSLKIML